MVLEVTGIDFRFYTNDELLSLCCTEITVPQTFNDANRPNKGGLYDTAMGPITRDTLCSTCGLTERHCPGHMGYIRLVTPVYQPLLLKEIIKLLSISCFQCAGLKMPAEDKFQLLDAGLLKEAIEILEQPESFLNKYGSKKKPIPWDAYEKKAFTLETCDMEQLEVIVEKLIENKAKSLGYTSVDEYLESSPKNILSITNERNKTVEKFIEECKQRRACPFCGQDKPGQIVFYNNVAIHCYIPLDYKVHSSMKGVPPPEKREKAKSHHFHPSCIRDFFKHLWDNDSQLLGAVYNSKKVDYGMFFMDIIPVIPNRYRPAQRMKGKAFEHVCNNIYRDIIIRNMQLKEEIEKGEGPYSDNALKYIELLQNSVNNLVDNELVKDFRLAYKGHKGFKASLEKKQGLFRMHMMGKRVNFAARSVILPDPYIETGEIGLPAVFAMRLSYPEPVTRCNYKELQQAVIRGPHHYPGANAVIDGERIYNLDRLNVTQRVALSKKLLSFGSTPKKVLRHVKNGDMLLMNRQPTLHRPSIMAHKARVLMGQKTLRLHYANCGSYNADFDGDEMNVHFPQNELSKAEAHLLLPTSKQYIVPTSGGPIRGLIQDHVVSAVLLTMKDSFYTKEEYQELVYGALFHRCNDHAIKTEPPCILKPTPLWTGKQIVTTILKDIAGNRKPINMDGTTRLKASLWGANGEEETQVIVRDNELLCGVFDKKQIGDSENSIIHAFYECYGDAAAADLLTCFTRLFTLHLQFKGFTCGLDDLCLNDEADRKREELFKEAEKDCHLASIKFANLNPEKADKQQLQTELAKLLQDDRNARQYDYRVKSTLHKYTSEVMKIALPGGQIKPFPKNNFSMMTQSGAKGSMVNFSQVSCCLGLQEFEGRRVKPMVSGKTLPSFEPYETSPMAGGYVASRFLTGIKPQEYFFHCMAGRDGLIDTAVKTARSGYLQRCLIKHLEGLSAHYDGTVRDNYGTVVQFKYGDDSIDPTKQSIMNEFKFMIMNKKALEDFYKMDQVAQAYEINNYAHKAVEYFHKKKKKNKNMDPLISILNPHQYFGAISDKYEESIREYAEKNADELVYESKKKIKKHQTKAITKTDFKKLASLKYITSLIEPGEPVGILAAQSIGEPSTQMTLNTFHFAGLDIAHVTVGIPRLRQLLMVGSVPPENWMMILPLKKGVTEEQANKVAEQLSELTFFKVLQRVDIEESVKVDHNSKIREIVLKLEFDEELIKKQEISRLTLSEAIEGELLGLIGKMINSQLKHLGRTVYVDSERPKIIKNREKAKDEGEDEEEEEDLDENGEKIKTDEVDYDDDEDERKSSDDEKEEEEEEEEEEDEEEVQTKKKKSKKYDDSSDDEEMYLDIPNRCAKFMKKAYLENTTLYIHLYFDVSVKLFLMQIVEDACEKSFIRKYKNVQKTTVLPSEKEIILHMEGTNFNKLWEMGDEFIDLQRIESNDINQIIQHYGIEAGRQQIVKDLCSVFDSYGITVDRRHISLIADYLTMEGEYHACNRHSFKGRPGPFHKMTFETSGGFLVKSTLHHETDDITGPSSRIVVGRNPGYGTGAFEVLQPLEHVLI